MSSLPRSVDRPCRPGTGPFGSTRVSFGPGSALLDGYLRPDELTGVPGAFCAGTDLADLATVPRRDTWPLPRIIGIQPALKRLYTGEMIGADEALRLGDVLDVVASDEFLTRAMDLANAIAAGSPHSLGLIKSLVHEGLTAPVGERMQRHTTALAACFESDDHREGVASLLDRRPAVFTGS